jgi:hypothetical protein
MRTALVLLLLLTSAPVAAEENAPRKQASATRKVRFNGRLLGTSELTTLERLERGVGRLDDGAYWYDPRTGASGRWGGPALAFLPPGLTLGGPLPADASGGGQGTLTGVFVNGRELHPLDVMGLQQLIGQVLPGRWWVDAQGNYGLEGGPPLGNLMLLARAHRGGSGRQAWSKHYEGLTPGQNMNLASDGTTTCVSTPSYSRCTGE